MDFKLSGYTVLTYDLYGRGYSDSTGKVEDLESFTGQLTELLFALGPATQGATTRPVHLLGVGTGAAIAAMFAKAHVESVQKVVLVSPYSGEDFSLSSFAADSFHKSDEGILEVGATISQQQKAHTSYENSVASTPHRFTKGRMYSSYEQFGNDSGITPILLMWGDQDKITPYTNVPKIQRLIPTAQFITLHQSGHLDPFTDVNSAKVFHAVVQRFIDDDLDTAEEALDMKAAKLLAQRQEKYLESVRDTIEKEQAEEEDATMEDKKHTKRSLQQVTGSLNITENVKSFDEEIDTFLAELDTVEVPSTEPNEKTTQKRVDPKPVTKKKMASKKSPKKEPQKTKEPEPVKKKKKKSILAKPRLSVSQTSRKDTTTSNAATTTSGEGTVDEGDKQKA